MDSEGIGERLRRLREKRGLKQQEVADLVGLKTKTSVSQMENGRVPRMPTLVKLAAIYGSTVNFLISGQEKEGVTAEEELPLSTSGRKLIREMEELLSIGDQKVEKDLRQAIDLVKRAHGLEG